MIKIGNTGIVGVYFGTTPITSIYNGVDKVYGDSPQYNPEEIVFEYVGGDKVTLPIYPKKVEGSTQYLKGSVDWGDGTISNNVSSSTNQTKPDIAHTYSKEGTYIVRFTPDADTTATFQICFMMTGYNNRKFTRILQYGNRPIELVNSPSINIQTYSNTNQALLGFGSPLLTNVSFNNQNNTILDTFTIGDISNASWSLNTAVRVLHFDNSIIGLEAPQFQVVDSNLEQITGNLDCSKGFNQYGTFIYNYPNLQRIESISLGVDTMTGKYILISEKINDMPNLTTMTIKNIGKVNNKIFDLSKATQWGVGSDEARQSLIDSLITYGTNNTQTIKISQATYDVLTKDELEQITAKGYTIVV